MSNPASISGVDLTTTQGRQILQDALDVLYGLIQKAGGTAAGPTTFDELRVRMLTVLGTINVVPEDKPPANVNSRLVTPWLTGQRGRGEVWRFEDQKDGGDLLEVRSQPYLIGTPTATAGDWEFRFTSAQRDPAGAYRSLGAIRFGSDGRLRTYDASEVLLFDSTLALTAANAPLPKRYVEGLVIRYASSTTVTVSAGKARDKADGADMTLAAAVTVDKTASGALGFETKTLTGTADFTNGSNAVTGTGTAFLTEFCPSNTRRALTGTISSAAGVVTGVGTKFLTEVSAGAAYGGSGGYSADLIGTTGKGFWQITGVTSDTSLTISLDGGAADPGFTAGTSAEAIECPQIGTAGGKRYQVGRITSNTALRCYPVTPNATETGVAITATAGAPNPALVSSHWRTVWLVSGGSGTSVVLSTQRTAPLLVGPGTVSPSGYATSYRKIGWVKLAGTTHNVEAIDSVDSGGSARRMHVWRVANAENCPSNASSLYLSASTFVASACAPPTADVLWCTLTTISPNVANTVVLAQRAAGVPPSGARERSAFLSVVTAPSTSTTSNVRGPITCDGAQGLEHWCYGGTASATGDGTYADVSAWEEVLE